MYVAKVGSLYIARNQDVDDSVKLTPRQSDAMRYSVKVSYSHSMVGLTGARFVKLKPRAATSAFGAGTAPSHELD
jgi:hypothetical protein